MTNITQVNSPDATTMAQMQSRAMRTLKGIPGSPSVDLLLLDVP
jgi:hypothetical protein